MAGTVNQKAVQKKKMRDVRQMFKPLREVWMNVRIKRIDTYKGRMVKALLDSKATGMFMSRSLAEKEGYKLITLNQLIQVRNVDDTSNSRGAITHEVEVNMFYKGHLKRVRMDVCELGKTDCNDETSRDDLSYHTQRYERTKRTRWSLSVDCATYLYTFLICLCVRLSNYRTFQKIPSCDLSCDQVMCPSYLILSPFSIFRTLRLVRLRIALVLPTPPTVLSLVLAGDL